MRMMCFANRTAKEILRDPLNIAFGLGFEVVLLLLLSMIQANIPVDLFVIESLAPGIAVFGLSFTSLFAATLISKDRGSALLSRLFTTPMRAGDYILGYTLPLLPMAVAQTIVCYVLAFILGMDISVNVVYSVLIMVPVAIFYVAFGLLCGTVMNDKQVGGVCGALFTNLSAWLSGTWFSLDLLGGWFNKFAYCLPFAHAVDMQRAVIAGNYSDIIPHLVWVLGYALVVTLIAVFVFMKKMKKD